MDLGSWLGSSSRGAVRSLCGSLIGAWLDLTVGRIDLVARVGLMQNQCVVDVRE
uniref:Uncharacterized protein n=1 Tax=Arundo donax TaxID=35708 RepID=A0A0A9AZG7_ARUDO